MPWKRSEARSDPAEGAARPPEPSPRGRSFELALRSKPQAWRAALGVSAGLLALAVALVGVLPLGALLARWSGGPVVDLARFRLTEETWIAGAVLLAALIPASAGLQRLLYRVPLGESASVAGRFRWRWAGWAALFVVPVFGGVALLLAASTSGTARPAGWAPFAIVVAVVTPLQAAGEEWIFRGLIARALAAPFARRGVASAVSLVGSSVLFCAGHGAADPVTIAYYLAAGAGLWLTAEFTGGLEAAALMHACANTFLLVPAVLAGSIGEATAPHGWQLLTAGTVWLLAPFCLRSLAGRARLQTERLIA